jgi:hypothetical protein
VRRGKWLLGLAGGLALWLAAAPLRAQDGVETFNFIYANYFGTGAYRLGDIKVAALQLPMLFTLRETRPGSFGIKLKLPVTAAVANFDFNSVPTNLPKVEDVRALSIVPGVEFHVPIGERWLVIPFVDAGAAFEFSSDTPVFTYGIGNQLYYSFSTGDTPWVIGNRLITVGQIVEGFGTTSDYSSFETGVDVGLPVRFRLFKRESRLHAHYINFQYFNGLEFISSDLERQSISALNELGMTIDFARPLGKGSTFSFSRLGLGYRFGDNAEGIRLLFSAPF